MIKRIQFAKRPAGQTPEEFARTWRRAASATVTAPKDARPLRTVASVSRDDIIAEPKEDGVIIDWFADDAHVAKFLEWFDSPAAMDAEGVVDEAAGPGGVRLMYVEEHIGRGADWLEDRWRTGESKLKHMALATRAEGLTPGQFSDKWKTKAGTIRNVQQGQTVQIPPEAKGLAYIQDHVLYDLSGDATYDAVNEVYFDDEASLKERIAFFTATLGEGTEDDLVKDNWFIAVDEIVVADHAATGAGQKD